jgi:hypothetical protein
MAEQTRDTLIELRDLVREFVDERDWDQFHTPKNLAVSLCVEAAELLEPKLQTCSCTSYASPTNSMWIYLRLCARSLRSTAQSTRRKRCEVAL